jgi:hypothetical protein
MHTNIGQENLKNRDHLDDLSIDGSYRNRVGACGLGSSGLGHKQVEGCYEHASEPAGSIKGGI